MAESGGTVANAFVQIMPSIEGATGSITQAIMPEVSAAGTSGGVVFGANLLGGVKGKLMGAGAAIVGALGVKTITGGLMSIGEEFDSMTDTIIVGTGASGDALDDLCDSAKSIAKQVPASFEDAGDVVQDLNTRMGMTGKDLEETGKRVIATGKLIGESVDVSKLTGSFNAFGVANEDAAAKMDYLFGVSQATGIGFNDLTGILETNAPVLQNLGFGFEQSANMAGLLDKAGMDASGTISKMSKALVNLTEPGKSVQETFQNVIGEMQGYIDKGDTAAALDIASKVFGTKGAAQFVGALQSGAFSLDDIANAALGAGDGIMGTMEATADWPEKWEILQNKAKAALEPLAGALMTGATEAMDLLGDALDGIDPETIDELGETLGGAFSDGVQVALNFAGYIIDNWPVAAGAVESVTTALQPLTQPIMDAAAEGASLLGDALGNIDPKSIEELAGTLGGGFSTGVGYLHDFATLIVDNWPTVSTIVGGVAGGLVAVKGALAISDTVGAFQAAMEGATGATSLMEGAQALLNNTLKANPIVAIVGVIAGLVSALIVAYNTNEDFRSTVNEAWESVWGTIEPIVTFIGDGLSSLGEWFGGLGESIGQWAEDTGNWWSDVGESASEFGQNVQEAIGGAWDTVTTKTGEAWETASGFLSEKWEGLKGTAADAWSYISGQVAENLNTAKEVGSESGAALTSLLSGDWESAKEHAANAYESIKNNITGKLDSAKGTAVSIADQIGDKLGFPGLGDTVGGVFDAVKSAIEDPIGTAKNYLHDAIEKIKGFFNFKISWPHIPMPHFNVSPAGWQIGDLLKGSIPSLSVEFYAQGGIIDKPTLGVIGEAGTEAVVPLTQPALKPFAQAVASQLQGGRGGDTTVHQTFNVYANDPAKVAAVVAADQRRSLCV